MSAKFPRGGSKPILSHPSISTYTYRVCFALYVEKQCKLVLVVGCAFHEKNFRWQNGVEAGIHANCVSICVANTMVR